MERQLRKASPALEVMETFYRSQGWMFERTAQDGLLLETRGQWCVYAVHCYVSPHRDLFTMTCTYGFHVKPSQYKELYPLLAEINSEMWIGHFDLKSQSGAPTFRYGQPIRGVKDFSLEQMEDIFDHALGECERFYPAFQSALFAGVRPRTAVDFCIMDHIGEA